MSRERNLEIANTLLKEMSTGQDPEKIAAAFAPDLVFEVQGDEGALPWIGRKTGREAMAGFLRDQRALAEQLEFNVEDVLASDERAVIVGSLAVRIKATGKTTAYQFALVLTVKNDVVTRFQMLEDSFDVAQAARA